MPWTIPLSGVGVRKKLASSGGYTIRMAAYQGTGPYVLTWTLDRFGQLADGGQAASEITTSHITDPYRFDGRQGQILRARVQRTAGVSLQPWLTLEDPSGAKEASTDGSSEGSALIQTKLASTGTYVLLVGGRNTGPYQVSLSLS